MCVVVWIDEGTWPACVDAARAFVPEGAEIVLPPVTGDVPGAAHGAFAGLLGRGRPERDPSTSVEQLAAASAEKLLGSAAHRLGRPCALSERAGRVEREVIAAVEGADLLVLARDGDRSRLGPRSLGPACRFVSIMPRALCCWSGRRRPPASPHPIPAAASSATDGHFGRLGMSATIRAWLPAIWQGRYLRCDQGHRRAMLGAWHGA